VSSRSRQLGTGFESELVKGFRSVGIDAERIRQAGRLDQGDVVVKDLGHIYVIEAKNVARIDLPGFIGQSLVEARNYAKPRGLSVEQVTPLAIIKRRGKGWLDSYVVTDLRSYFDLGTV
jgi:hypothetical protein